MTAFLMRVLYVHVMVYFIPPIVPRVMKRVPCSVTLQAFQRYRQSCYNLKHISQIQQAEDLFNKARCGQQYTLLPTIRKPAPSVCADEHRH